MRPSYRHASLLKALRSLAMRGFRASPGGKMARLKPETYYLPAPKQGDFGPPNGARSINITLFNLSTLFLLRSTLQIE